VIRRVSARVRIQRCRLRNGLCCECGKVRVRDGSWRCRKCQHIVNQSIELNRSLLAKHGRCVDCRAKKGPTETRLRCLKCRVDRAERERQRRRAAQVAA
jgi:hypothetical protein